MTDELKKELKNQIDFFIKKMKIDEKYDNYCKENSLVDDLEAAIKFSIDCAYGTAKRTFKNVINSESAKRELEEVAYAYFNPEKFPDTQEAFNEKHIKMCNAWIEGLDKNESVNNKTYGKAQKVVNMMFKYMYCYSYRNGFENIQKSAFDFCHMTLDSYTLKWISDVWEKNAGAKIIKSDTTWSKLDDDKYKDIVKLIEEKIKDPKTEEYDFTGYKKIELEFFIWDYEKLIEALKYMKKIMVSYKDHKDEDLINLGEASEKLVEKAKKIIKKQTIKKIPAFDDKEDNDF